VPTLVNGVDFGTKQTGQALDGVGLPPWAKDPFDFVVGPLYELNPVHPI
jgi:hypothetical protein